MEFSLKSIEYNLFLLDSLLEDHKLELYINESILLASEYPTIEQFKIVHEGFSAKIKETFSKLLAMIANLWKKFTYTMNNILSTDKKYLETHKDIILKKPLAEDEYIMYPYWTGYNQLKEFKVPAFNFPALKDSLKSKDDFISRHFNSYIKGDLSLNDSLRQTFRGGVDKEQRVASSKINLVDMYNYCIEFESIKKRLETDMKEIEKAGDNAIDIIDKMKMDTTSASNEGAIYSFVKEAVIYEANPQKVSDIEKKDGAEKNSSIDGERDTNNKNIEDNVTNKNDDINKIKTYIEVCYSALGVKMSIAQECYKSYMFIIRDHVKSHIGTKKTTTSTTKEPAKQDTKNTSGDMKKGWLQNMKDKATPKDNKK